MNLGAGMSAAARPPEASPQGSSSSPQNQGNGRGPKSFSCVLCAQRKVKCDRQDPCANCTKQKAQCIYRPPAPPRRRKRRSPEQILIARLKQYEDLLQKNNIDPKEAEGEGCWEGLMDGTQDGPTPPQPAPPTDAPPSGVVRSTGDAWESMYSQGKAGIYDGGKLVKESDGGSRYLQNNFWKNLSHQFRDPNEIFDHSDEDDETPGDTSTDVWSFVGATPASYRDLAFGHYAQNTSLRSLHPEQSQISHLWQLFAENFDPLVKCIHTPTVKQRYFEAAADLEQVSRNFEALMFAIYLGAVTSLDNDQCMEQFGEMKTHLVGRMRVACEQALLNASFMRNNDMTVLQAFLMYLLCTRAYHDASSIWIYTGMAVRIAQRIGLHRDGTTLSLSPFETEMRRRLWWQIVILDSRSGELSGAGLSVFALMWDALPPLNVNDADLHEGMETFPEEHRGATDMIFCRLRYEFGSYFRTLHQTYETIPLCPPAQGHDVDVKLKLARIDELERILGDKYLRYCDPSIPVHFISAMVARGATIVMRLVAQHPRQYPDQSVVSTEQRDAVFALSSKILEYDGIFNSTAMLRRFLWHANAYFSWDAMIFILSELRASRFQGGEVDKAWQLMEKTYANHQDVATSRNNALCVAVRRLTLKAWEARTARVPGLQTPLWIENLRKIEEKPRTASAPKASTQQFAASQAQPGETQMMDRNMLLDIDLDVAQQNIDPSSFPMDMTASLDQSFYPIGMPSGQSPINWAEWDTLLKDVESLPPEQPSEQPPQDYMRSMAGLGMGSQGLDWGEL